MTRPTSIGGPFLSACKRMKTVTQSGQAWRGYERALKSIIA